MAVNLSNAEIRQFELAGITKEQIGKTIERDRAAGLSDQDIALKAMMKADQLAKDNPALEGSIVRGGLRAISNLPFGDTINRGFMGEKALSDAYTSVPNDMTRAAVNATLDYITGNNKPTLRQYLEAPEGTTPPDRSWKQVYKDKYNELREGKGETFSENYTKNMNKLERTFKEQNYDVPKPIRWTLDAAGTIGSYGLLPEGIYETVPRAAAFGALDAYQSGINKDTNNRIINALIGGVTSGAATGIMNKVTGASAMQKAEKEYPLLAEGFKKNPPKSADEALEKLTTNYIKYTENPSLAGRATEEAKKLFSNMDTNTLKSIGVTEGKPLWKSPMGQATTKGVKEALKLKGRGATVKANRILNNLNDFAVKIPEMAKPSTEGLTGGVLGALGGGWIGGPVGGIAGALLGSKGKIGSALGAAGELLLGNSGKGLTKAMVNPQGTNAVIRALRKAPGFTGTIQKAAAPVIRNSYEEDKTSYRPSRQYKKTTKQTSNAIPNATIVLPDNDNGESITEKHLKLLAALYPQYYQKVA